MLEEEGFIEAATNRRSRVAGFAAEQLDSDYASRILLESLAFDLTVRDLSPRDAASLLDLNNEMRKNAQNDRIDQWFSIHAGFHERLTCGANPTVLKQVRTYRDRSIRYIRTVQATSPGTWMTDGESEHSAIVEALMDGDRALARTTLAEHLASTAYRVLSHLAADYDPVAVKGALSLVSDRGPLPDHPELGRQVG